MLESELLSHDNRLRPDNSKHETIISCEISRIDSSEKWEERRSTERKKTGEKQVWNEKKQKYETKDVMEDVEVKRNYKVVTGAINASYTVKDVKTGAILDSDSFPLTDTRAFLDGVGAPDPQEFEHKLVRNVVYSIVPRLTPTTETVKVLLAQGKLKDISKFGEAGLWQKMVEAFEMMPALKNPKDDAYRLYNTGVGYEALAYKAEELTTTKKFLDKAAVLYGQAYEANPGEKYFKEPQLRIEIAITQYRKLMEQIAAYSRAKELKDKEAPPVANVDPAGPGGDPVGGKGLTSTSDTKPIIGQPSGTKPFTNQDIINLAKQGLDETNLIASIKGARVVQFDLSPQSLTELLQNKISNRVIGAMRLKQAASREDSGQPRRRAQRRSA
jgi:hypothetical protein